MDINGLDHILNLTFIEIYFASGHWYTQTYSEIEEQLSCENLMQWPKKGHIYIHMDKWAGKEVLHIEHFDNK